LLLLLDARLDAILTPHGFVDIFDNRAQLTLVICRANHKIISNRALVANIQQNNFRSLLVFDQFDNPPSKKCNIYESSSSKMMR
jgi:hypothetical protein